MTHKILDKTRRLKECKDLFKYRAEKAFDYCYYDTLDLKVIYDITPRQTGTTTAIAYNFDMETDMYISHNMECIREFNRKLNLAGKSNTVAIKFPYLYLPFEKKLSDIIALQNIADKMGYDIEIKNGPDWKKLNNIRGRKIIGIIWIDLGMGVIKYQSKELDSLISVLSGIYPEAKFIIC